MEMVYGIVDAVNGHFMLGVKKIIGGYFRNRRNNKKYEKLLKGAGGKLQMNHIKNIWKMFLKRNILLLQNGFIRYSILLYSVWA